MFGEPFKNTAAYFSRASMTEKKVLTRSKPGDDAAVGAVDVVVTGVVDGLVVVGKLLGAVEAAAVQLEVRNRNRLNQVRK